MKSKESFIYNPRNTHNNYIDFSTRPNIKKMPHSKKPDRTSQLSRSLPKETKKIDLMSQSLIEVFRQNIPLNNKSNIDSKQKCLNRSDCFQQENITRNKRNQRNKSKASSISTSDPKLKSFLIEKESKRYNKICKSSLGKPAKSLLTSKDPIYNQVYINSNINNINCQIIPDRNNQEIENMSGPEDIHFVLVNIFQKKKGVYLKLSESLHQLNDGVAKDYLDIE